MALIDRLWSIISGRRVEPPPRRAAPLEVEDEPEIIVELDFASSRPELPRSQQVEHPIVGTVVQILYRDSKGVTGARRVNCRRIETVGSTSYLFAFCEERGAFRRFRIDRILEVADLETGEMLPPDRFFAGFSVDDERESSLTFGLGVHRFADLSAGLKVLTFLARCDGERSAEEVDVIGDFIRSFWQVLERTDPPPMRDILKHVGRMAPLSEDVTTALLSAAEKPWLAGMLADCCEDMVSADGVIDPAERHWAELAVRYLRDPSGE